MSQLFEILQEPLTIERGTRTILALLREKMDGVDHHHHGRLTRRRSRTLKERLGWRGMGCCGGATWGFRPTTTTTTIINGSDSEDDQQHHQHHHQLQVQLLQEDQQEPTNQETINVSDPACSSPAPVNSSGSHSMNLAAALAAERHFRAVEGTNLVDVNNNNSNSGGGGGGGNVGSTITAPGTPLRVSLMRLLAETDGGDGETERAAVGVGGGGGGGNDTVCCVCMVRKKGAAFIPCGHTFCRVCSREVLLNRGSCPLCNRSILEILDIF